MRRLAALALVAWLVLGCGRGGDGPLPAFALTNQSGRTVQAQELRGRAVIVTFIFTTCVEACPILTAQLVRLQGLLGREGLAERVRFVAITVDPVTDTPDVLGRYARRFGADLGSWDFLTGPPEEIARLTRALGVGTAPGKRGLAHDAPILFVDPAGRIVERRVDLELAPDPVLALLRRLVG
jgi:protein SCO1/2